MARCILAVLAVATPVVFVLLYFYLPYQQIYTYIYPSSDDKTDITTNTQEPLRVHYYNKPKSVSKSVFKSCKHRCFLTHGKSSYNTSHVVMFHGPTLGTSGQSPPPKIQNQIWILHGKESAVNYQGSLEAWKDMFNWTMTYRRDSDIVALNGIFFRKKGRPNHKNLTSLFASKSKDAAWFVSNCHTQSRREKYIEKLNGLVHVDIYGTCGKNTCTRANDKTCMYILSHDFKFYLSFENSFCHDYITEKSFKIYWNQAYVIPVTRGLQLRGQYEMYLPPRSFIDTANFTSMKELVRYMGTVSGSQHLYNSYFSWHSVYSSSRYTPRDFCELCEKLHGEHKYRRVYRDISAWLKTGPHGRACSNRNDSSIMK